jgi:hypothetical protein
MRSSVYDAQSALVGLLEGIPAASTANISLGHPARMGRREIWVGGDAEDWGVTYRQSGLAARDEEYVLRIHAFVMLTGADYTKVRDEVRTYTDAIEDALAANPTLGGAVMLATVTDPSLDEGIGQDGRSRMVLETLGVRIKAHVDAG